MKGEGEGGLDVGLLGRCDRVGFFTGVGIGNVSLSNAPFLLMAGSVPCSAGFLGACMYIQGVTLWQLPAWPKKAPKITCSWFFD